MSQKNIRRVVWNRYRFSANLDDPRPVTFPPPGPYWVSGESDTHAIVVAFLPKGVAVTTYWPEAEDIDVSEDVPLTFTDRFARPQWWIA